MPPTIDLRPNPTTTNAWAGTFPRDCDACATPITWYQAPFLSGSITAPGGRAKVRGTFCTDCASTYDGHGDHFEWHDTTCSYHKASKVRG